MSEQYKQSGVNIESGYEAVKKIQKHIKRTQRPEVLSDIGGFGGLFSLASFNYKQPVLVSGTDGVGTKILLAQEAGLLSTIGIDCVAMCVNDVLAQGAEPLFFLDYLAVGENQPEKIEAIVAGVVEGCVQAGAALIGGETAEMPDLYAKDEFDLAGFCVGIVDQENLITGDKILEGDCLIALPSSGIHSNGYSLVRKVFFKDNHYAYDEPLDDGQTLIEHLLTPTKIYVKDVLPLVKQGFVNGIAHITGGGFDENIPRMYSDEFCANIYLDRIEVPLIFKTIQKLGNIDQREMFQVFNMGVGMVLAVKEEHVQTVLNHITNAYVLGYISKNNEEKIKFIKEV